MPETLPIIAELIIIDGMYEQSTNVRTTTLRGSRGQDDSIEWSVHDRQQEARTTAVRPVQGQCEDSREPNSHAHSVRYRSCPRTYDVCPILERNMNFDTRYREAAHKRFEESCGFQNAYSVKYRFPTACSHAAFRSSSTLKM